MLHHVYAAQLGSLHGLTSPWRTAGLGPKLCVEMQRQAAALLHYREHAALFICCQVTGHVPHMNTIRHTARCFKIAYMHACMVLGEPFSRH